MRETWAAVGAIVVKDWTRFFRQPFFMVISVIIPLVFIFFYSLIVPVSATNPIMIADEDHTPASAQFIDAMRDIRSVEAPYYEIITTDATTTREAFNDQTALAMVVIPDGFADDVAAGNAQVELHLNNINSDYSKNLRLRLDYATRLVNDQLAGPVVEIKETSWLLVDPTMLGYISTSLLLFGVLYASMVNTGLNVASEWNDRTVKNLLLAPVGRGALVTGKVLSGLGQSVLSIALVLLVLIVGFGFQPRGNPLLMAGIVLLTMLLGAGIGALAGVLSKKTLAVTSGLITVAILLFLVSGNEDSMRGLAWGQPITALWQFSLALPPTYAFGAARSLFLTGETSTLIRDLAIVASAAAVLLSLAVVALRRAYS
ncbi:MAG: ABC transporter permease, partial [Propioniciclava sp.]